MDIIGQSQTGTIINGTGNNWIFYIPNNINISIQNIMLTGGTAVNGGAINNNGVCTVSNCILKSNAATNGYDGKDYDFHNDGGNGGNGGAIYNTGTFTLINTTIISNTAGNGGNGGDGYEGGIDDDGYKGGNAGSGGSGGAIYNTGTLTINNTKFISNTAGNGGNGGNGGDGGPGGLFVPTNSNRW